MFDVIKKSIKVHVAILASFLLLAGIYFHPNHPSKTSNWTLTYDVAGYYMYLPATFIYKDLKEYSFQDTLKTPEINVGIHHGKVDPNTGNFVFKYSSGMAIQYLPFFAAAHVWAKNSKRFKANGFSYPYHFCIHFGSLFIALLGMLFLYFALKNFFSPWLAFLSCLSILIGSNYLLYATFHGAMSHNYLFTINSILLFLLPKFYKTPSKSGALIIGALIGFAILIRPTEALIGFLALSWGTALFDKKNRTNRVQFFKDNRSTYGLALLTVVLIGSIQLLYWYYVTGRPLFYSYGSDQGFDWLSPHIIDCLFSTKAGWLTYSPLMIFSLLGFIPLWKKHPKVAQPLVVFILIFMYICFSWRIWWYGGSLGQRAMIQAYPMLAFPLAGFYAWVSRTKRIKILTPVLFIGFVYLNLWFIYMATKGPVFFSPPQVKTKYFFKQVGRWKQDKNNLKFLDSKEELSKNVLSSKIIVDTAFLNPLQLLPGPSKKLKLHLSDIASKEDEWLRVKAQMKKNHTEWTWWKYSQLVVQIFNKNGKHIKSNFIRVDRLLENGKSEWLEFDTELPPSTESEVKVFLLNCGSHVPLEIQALKIEKLST